VSWHLSNSETRLPNKNSKYEKQEILNYPTVKAWIAQFESKYNTYKSYRQHIVIFFETMNLSPDEFNQLDERKIKGLILDYKNKMLASGKSVNGVLSVIVAVRSYLIDIDKAVTFRRGQLPSIQADTDSHVFTNGDLKRMFDVGGTFEKALLATAASEGWEISAFLEQDRNIVERRIEHAKQNGLRFVFFLSTRGKTGMPRLCVLNPLAVEWLSKYFVIRNDDDPRLFPITVEGVQKLLVRLAKDADLKTTGNLRFHRIRAWLMSRLSRCGFNEFQIKYILGKAIGVSDATYLHTLQAEIEEKYPRMYEDYLNISPQAKVMHSKLANLSDEQVDLLLEFLRERAREKLVR